MLLEGGDENYTTDSQNLYKGKVIGDKYFPLDVSRLRFLGGTSNHWTGWCRAMDAEDFVGKEGFPLTQWPINKNNLNGYLNKASEILEIDPIPADRIIEGSGVKGIDFNFSPPVRFKDKYIARIKDSSNIYLATNANVTSIVPTDNTVQSVSVTHDDNEKTSFTAHQYVLATGGIENSRILLWSNALSNGELIKNSSTLGRYWMEHPTFTIGEAFLTAKAHFEINKYGLACFSPTKQQMDNDRILNCGIRLEPTQYSKANQMFADLMCAAPKAGKWAADLLGKKLICSARIRAAWEQEPQASNRIELTEKKDRLGIPVINLHYKKSANDIRTAKKSVEALADYLAANKLGRVKLNDWVIKGEAFPDDDDDLAGYHHMGGTRMASSPDQGIVDKDCKVHGPGQFVYCGVINFP